MPAGCPSPVQRARCRCRRARWSRTRSPARCRTARRTGARWRRRVSSNSAPAECALGTLKEMREEQEPASSVTCRSLHVGIEERGIQRDVAAGARLDARLVVPQGLVVVVLEAAEDGLVFVRAQRVVQRIVDAAEAEALRGLGIEGHAVVELVAHQKARGDAVGGGLVHDVVVAGREQAALGDRALLVEVVVARAAGEGQAIGNVVGGLAEQRELFEVVRQVGVVGRVRGKAVGDCRRRARAEYLIGVGVVAGVGRRWR